MTYLVVTWTVISDAIPLCIINALEVNLHHIVAELYKSSTTTEDLFSPIMHIPKMFMSSVQRSELRRGAEL